MCGPLLVRSVRTTSRVPSPPAAAAWTRGDRGRARLHDQRPGDGAEAEAGGERRRAVERLLLRHREARGRARRSSNPPRSSSARAVTCAATSRLETSAAGPCQRTNGDDQAAFSGMYAFSNFILGRHRDRHPADRDEPVLAVGVVDLPDPRRAAPVARAGARRDPLAARGLQEARVVGDPHRREPVLVDVRDRRLGGEHLGQRRVGAAVHEPEALAHAVGDREARDRLAVADRDDLEPEDAVEAVLLGDRPRRRVGGMPTGR